MKRSLVYIASSWLPVIIGLCIIATESTDHFSAAHTHGWMHQLLEWLGIHMTDARLEEINHILRKTGHFIGYGGLSLLFWRAWYRTLRNAASEALLSFRLRCAALALLGTLITASLDEWHQSFIPSRTSTPVDVALDMVGAVVCHLLLFMICWIIGRQKNRSPEAYA